ncbi:MAG: DUF2490 domain-containing protein [Prevotella sp.]|nr:DUF2490 domain-containing protein [Prevotella sp.]
MYIPKRLSSLFAAAVVALPSLAEGSDFGMWYGVEVSHKLTQQWSFDANAELSNRNNTKTLDSWQLGLEASYKPVKWLKLSAGYYLKDKNRQEKLTMHSDGQTPNKWTPGYWGLRHRVKVSLTGSIDWGRFSFSLRERYQLTYRPEADGKKYDVDNDEWDPVKAKTSHTLRSRLQVDYNIPRCKIDPFAGVEMFNGKDGIEKMRYQVGVVYKWRKQHSFDLTYRYQHYYDSADDDDNTGEHLIGLGYKYKF